jgi:tetratricopeptide (TPR) repeat protein
MVLWSREGGWRYADAYRSARRAIALKPSLASAHNQLGALYFHYGLLAEGRHAFETSLALDPSNPDSPARLPRILWYQQRFDSALAYFERGVGFAYEHALVLAYLGRSAEGLDVLARHEGSQVRDRGDYSASRAVLLARLGRGSEAESAIQAAIRAGGATSHFHHASYSIATAYAILGRRDEALRWLGQTANNGMPAYELFLGDPALENLREDPRFAAFLERQRATYDAFRLLTLR